MNSPCAECLRGPSGIEGHPSLFVGTMGSSRLGFTCRDCGWVWARSYAGEGDFRWTVDPNPSSHKTLDLGWFVPGPTGVAGN